MRCPHNAKFTLVEMVVSINQILNLFLFGTARSLKYYLSNVIDGYVNLISTDGNFKSCGHTYLVSSCVVCSASFLQPLHFRDCLQFTLRFSYTCKSIFGLLASLKYCGINLSQQSNIQVTGIMRLSWPRRGMRLTPYSSFNFRQLCLQILTSDTHGVH